MGEACATFFPLHASGCEPQSGDMGHLKGQLFPQSRTFRHVVALFDATTPPPAA
jgi:hypothetical protein